MTPALYNKTANRPIPGVDTALQANQHSTTDDVVSDGKFIRHRFARRQDQSEH